MMKIGENLFKKEIKDKSIRIRVTENERNQINELAKNKGMTSSDYIRYCILEDVNKNT